MFVLPVISRIFEKLIFDQLYQHMNENNLFSAEKSGFWRLHLTLSCLLKTQMTGTMAWTLVSLWVSFH